MGLQHSLVLLMHLQRKEPTAESTPWPDALAADVTQAESSTAATQQSPMMSAVLSGAKDGVLHCWPVWCNGQPGALQQGHPLEHCSKGSRGALRQGALAGPKEALRSSKSQTDTAHVRKPRPLHARLVPQTPCREPSPDSLPDSVPWEHIHDACPIKCAKQWLLAWCWPTFTHT